MSARLSRRERLRAGTAPSASTGNLRRSAMCAVALTACLTIVAGNAVAAGNDMDEFARGNRLRQEYRAMRAAVKDADLPMPVVAMVPRPEPRGPESAGLKVLLGIAAAIALTGSIAGGVYAGLRNRTGEEAGSAPGDDTGEEPPDNVEVPPAPVYRPPDESPLGRALRLKQERDGHAARIEYLLNRMRASR